MDATGCPSGWATDTFYDWHATPGSCNASLPSVIGIFSVIIFLRFSLFLHICRLWRQARQIEAKRRNERGVSSFGQNRRLPIIPSLHLASVIILSTMFGLLITNRISAIKGTSHILIIAWVTPFYLIECLALRKMVRLGQKIIPWNSVSQRGFIDSKLGTFDGVLRILVVCMVILFLIVWVTAIIGCFVETLLLDQISLSALLIQQVLHFTSLVYQYERCIKCIREARKFQPNLQSVRGDLEKAWFRMRFQQGSMLVVGILCSAIIAFFAGTLRSPWFGPCMAFVVELVAYGLMAVSISKVENTSKDATNDEGDSRLRDSRLPMNSQALVTSPKITATESL